MCTLSWQIDDSFRLSLFFNRDELFSRPDALPPEVHRPDANSARFIAPTDPQGGGTWIAANEFGITLCLLNDYQGRSVENLNDKAKSRGLLVRELIALKSAKEVESAMNLSRVKVFQPFNLVMFDGVKSPVMWNWDGERLHYTNEPAHPIVSAGIAQPEVQRKRAAVFREETERQGGKLTSAQQLALHRSKRPEPQPWSIAMQLDDKGTVSITQVEVLVKGESARNAYEMKMRYWPGKPLEVRPKPYEATLGD